MGVVFAKTPQGHEEIQTRVGQLTPRVRRVLIFIDGRRTVDDLRAMLQSDDLQHTLGMLEEEGYIEVAAVTDAAGKAGSAAEPLPSVTAFTELPTQLDRERLEKARNFMINTLNHFVGPLGANPILENIYRCKDHEQLRTVYDTWYHAIVMSRDGKRQAETLRSKLLDVI